MNHPNRRNASKSLLFNKTVTGHYRYLPVEESGFLITLGTRDRDASHAEKRGHKRLQQVARSTEEAKGRDDDFQPITST